jgi:hypothetical protein
MEMVDGHTRPLSTLKQLAAGGTSERVKSSRILKRRKRSEDESDDETLSNSEFSENDMNSDMEDDPLWKPGMDIDKQSSSLVVDCPSAVHRPLITTVKSHPTRAKAGRASGRSKGNNPAAVSISTTPTGYVLQVGAETGTHYQDVIPFNPNDPHHYQKGDFVIERKDLHKSNGFPIWKIEVGRLLQKFDPELQSDGSLIHKSASIYSSWSGNIRTTFKAIETQVVVGTGRRQEVVRILPKYLPQPVDDGLETDPLMDLFNVYIQCLLSQAIDPTFLSVLRQQKEEYYDGPLRQIDSLLETARLAILAQIQWKDMFQNAVDTLPYYSLSDISSCDVSQTCQATDSGEQAVKLVYLYGPLYSRDDLTNTSRQVHRADSKGIAIGPSAVDNFGMYHEMQHYRYLLYKKCIEEVVYARQSKTKSDADILAGCLQNRIFIQQLFRELKETLQKFIVISVIDMSEIADQGSPPDDVQQPSLESVGPSTVGMESSSETVMPSEEASIPRTGPSAEPVELSLEPQTEPLLEPSVTADACELFESVDCGIDQLLLPSCADQLRLEPSGQLQLSD